MGGLGVGRLEGLPSGAQMPNDPIAARRSMARLAGPRLADSRDPAWFDFEGGTLEPDHVWRLLHPYLTEARRRRIEAALANRTYSLAVVMEGVVDTGNVSAVMRSADAFGVQAFHLVDTAAAYKHSKRTAQGAEKWLDRRRWRSVNGCVEHLRAAGMRLVGTGVEPGSRVVEEVDFSRPSAVVLGNELSGLSAEMRSACDILVRVPTVGFSESLNVSVAAGVCLWQAHQDRVARLGTHGDLDDSDRRRLRAVFAMKSVRHHRPLIERLLADEVSRRP